jgi:hypothetical protein
MVDSTVRWYLALLRQVAEWNWASERLARNGLPQQRQLRQRPSRPVRRRASWR